MKDFSASAASGSKGRFLRRSLRDSISAMHAGRKCSRQRELPAKSMAAEALQDVAAHQVGSWRSGASDDDAISCCIVAALAFTALESVSEFEIRCLSG